jgi:hypothetical protein
MSDSDAEDFQDAYGVADDIYDELEEMGPTKEGDEDEEDYDNAPPTQLPSGSVKYITGANRRTDPIMTLKEYTRLISTLAMMYDRKLQVHPLVAARQGQIFDSLDLATLHISMKEVPCPVVIERPVADGVEVWKRDEMVLPSELLHLFTQVAPNVQLR